MVCLLSFPAAAWTRKEANLGGLHEPNNPFVSAVCDRLIRDPVDKLEVGLCKISVGKHPVLGKAH